MINIYCRNKPNIIAVYRGEEILGIGTYKQMAKSIGVSINRLRNLTSPSTRAIEDKRRYTCRLEIVKLGKAEVIDGEFY